MSEPRYISCDLGEARIWTAGVGRPVIVLGGLTTATSTRVQALAMAGGGTFVGLELPGFGASEGGTGRPTVESSADFVIAVRAALNAESAPILAFDGAATVASTLVARGAIQAQRVGLVDTDVIEQWRADTEADPVHARVLRSDGLHLIELWTFLRDRALLRGKKVSREGPPLPGVAELEAAFLAAIEDFKGYWTLWDACIRVERELLGTKLHSPVAVAAWLEGFEASDDWTVPVSVPTRRTYVRTPRGRMHCRVRWGGERTVFAFASAPGSAEPLTPLLDRLGKYATVIAPDYLGNGDSDKPDREVDIRWTAESMLELADVLDIPQFDLWGTHTGALVALEIALLAPDRVGKVVLEAPILLSNEETSDITANYFHDIAGTDWGDHVLRAWNLRRDMFMFWPWFTRNRATSRAIGVPDNETLHRWTVGLLKSGRTYSYTYRAAFLYPTAERLLDLTVPSLICAGPADMLADGLESAGRLTPGSLTQMTPATIWYPSQCPHAVDVTLSLYEQFLELTE
jgi:pimeloyl-ACP methyl ester carboxylesterase